VALQYAADDCGVSGCLFGIAVAVRFSRLCWLLLAALALPVVPRAFAIPVQPDSARVPGWVSCERGVDEHACSLVADVAQRLAREARIDSRYSWPPHIVVQASARINAQSWSGSPTTYGRICRERLGIDPLDPTLSRARTLVIVTEAVVTQVAGDDPDRLSLIIGHEFGHLVLEHSQAAL